jgi:hypothetical protein
MISKLKIIIPVLMILSISSHVFAQDRKNYFLSPQIGGWFGVVAPVGQTANLIQTNLGGGGFFRINLPPDFLKLGLDVSYQNFKSRGVNELTFVPIYGTALFLLPLNLPIKIQIKIGAGAAYMQIKPDLSEQMEPIFTGGAEVSFPAGKFINIGLRLEYFYIMEAAVVPKAPGGHIFNAGICLYFNIIP